MTVTHLALPRQRTIRSGASTALLVAAIVIAVNVCGCIGARFDAARPVPALDNPTQVIYERISAARAAKNLPGATWVEDLRPPAVRAAISVARGELSLTAAVHQAAQGGVTAMGRHVYAFGADCPDPQRFRPPAMAAEKTLLLALAAAPPGNVAGPPGHVYVILLIADPGSSALRADQMGGGRGGSNPSLEMYAHPSVATRPCGETWPSPPSVPF